MNHIARVRIVVRIRSKPASDGSAEFTGLIFPEPAFNDFLALACVFFRLAKL